MSLNNIKFLVGLLLFHDFSVYFFISPFSQKQENKFYIKFEHLDNGSKIKEQKDIFNFGYLTETILKNL